MSIWFHHNLRDQCNSASIAKGQNFKILSQFYPVFQRVICNILWVYKDTVKKIWASFHGYNLPEEWYMLMPWLWEDVRKLPLQDDIVGLIYIYCMIIVICIHIGTINHTPSILWICYLGFVISASPCWSVCVRVLVFTTS